MGIVPQCCRDACLAFHSCWSALPFMAVIAFIISLAGFITSGGAKARVVEGLDLLNPDSEEVKDVGHGALIWIPFSFLLTVDVFAMIISAVAAGSTRKWIFGSQSKSKPCLMHCFKFLVGPCFAGVVEVMVMVTIGVQLAFSYALLFLLVIFKWMATMCDGTPAMRTKFTELSDVMQTAGEGTPHLDKNFKLATYCSGASKADEAATTFFIGAVLTVVGQMFMCASLTADIYRIRNEMKKAWVGDGKDLDEVVQEQDPYDELAGSRLLGGRARLDLAPAVA